MFHNTPSGFVMTFENGWEISVQWGPGNYCSTRYDELMKDTNPWDGKHYNYQSRTAEIAVTHKDHKDYYPLSDHDDVKGWVQTEEVAEYIQWTAQLSSNFHQVMADAEHEGLAFLKNPIS